MRLCCFTFRRIQLLTVLFTASVIIAILMILFLFNWPTIVRQRIINEVIFKNGSDALERFRTTKEIKNLRLSFHLYNVTNPNEVISDPQVKINLQEIGPFVYKELKIREFVDNNQETGLISYKPRTIYTFDREASVGDPSKILLTWPNVPLMAAQAVLDELPFYTRTPAYYAFNKAIDKFKEPAFITDTVENFLFKGSKRDLFEYIQKNFDIFHMFEPWPLKDNRFAMLYDRNNTWRPGKDYVMTSAAGFGPNQTYQDVNSYVYINGSASLPFWEKNPPTCNKLGGTDGEVFSPFLNRNQSIQVYSMDICRKLKLKYVQDYIISGIPVYRYILDDKSLLSGQSNPENKCFCLSYSSTGVPAPECNIDGLIDLASCNNPNVYASGAHFYQGSPELLTRVTGISSPNASLHEPIIHVEPNSGLAVKVKVPLQFNIRLVKNKFKNFNFFNDPQALIIPLVWVEEAAELTEDQAALLKSKLILLDSWFISMVLGGSIIFLLVIIVIGVIVCIRYRDSRIANSVLEDPLEATETDPLITASIASETRSYTNPTVVEDNVQQN